MANIPTVTDKIVLPSTWKGLVQTVFSDPPEVEHGASSIASHPEPRTGDCRRARTVLKDGTLVITELASGMNNYFANHLLQNVETPITHYTTPCHCLEDTELIETDQKIFHLKVEWREPLGDFRHDLYLK